MKPAILLAILLGSTTAFSQSSLENFGMAINTGYSEFRPTISYDGRSIYFTRQGDPENTDNHQAVWYSSVDQEGNWQTPIACTGTINAQKDNSVFWTSPDGNKILIRGAYENGKYVGRGFSFCTKTENGWSAATKLNIKGYPKISVDYNDGACLSPDEKHLFIYLSGDKNSQLNDIYESHVNEKNEWSYPVIIQEGISMDDYDEVAPFVSFDNTTMYFSSNRPGGLGGYDIWMSKRLDDSWMHWSAPVNMGSVINSSQWESYYSTDANGEFGYVSKTKLGSTTSDIFRIKLKDIQHAVDFYGNVFNASNHLKLNDVQFRIWRLTEKESEQINADITRGDFTYNFKLPTGCKYIVQVEVDGFGLVQDTVDATNNLFDNSIHKDYFVGKIQQQVEPISIYTKVLFGFSESSIKNKCMINELDRITEMIKSNAALHVNLVGYTDNVGPQEFNKKLSTERAAVVRQFLISKGIEPNRIEFEGRGENDPVGDNSTAAGRTINRRVEIRILSN